MKSYAILLCGALVALPATLILTASRSAGEAGRSRIEHGKYLVNLGGCTDCHTPLKMGPKGPEPDLSRYLSGHPEDAHTPPPPKLPAGPWFAMTAGMTAWAGPWGVSYAANLTPDPNTGLGIWTEAMFIQAMRTGKHFGVGRDILPPMPWQTLSQLSDADLKDMYAYLRSLPPVKNHVPVPVPPTGVVNYE
jgi:mono/diheme cytochrome c family protein